MENSDWLPLLNYSTKHNISLSTLRRRIKSESIVFKLEHGKYYILDETTHHSPGPTAQSTTLGTPEKSHGVAASHSRENHLHHDSALSSSFVEASVLSSANRLVEEIKAAYAKILQEKEEQIGQLKEEISDLRMLCRILEDNSNKKPSPKSEVSEGPKNSSDDFLFGDFQNREI